MSARLCRNYLEHYIESAEVLPSELQRNLSRWKESDSQYLRDIDKIEELLFEIDNVPEDEKRKKMASIVDNLKSCLEYGKEKVHMATSSYDQVEYHIQRLDQDIENIDNLEDLPDNEERYNKRRKFEKRDSDVEGMNDKGKKRKLERKYIEHMDGNNKKKARRKDAADEETYCICNQVSYGEMIGCDNDNCKTEWFHFSCMSLTSKPKGEWFCPDCIKSLVGW